MPSSAADSLYTIQTFSRLFHAPAVPRKENSSVSKLPFRLGGRSGRGSTHPPTVPPQGLEEVAFQCSCDPSAYPWPTMLLWPAITITCSGLAADEATVATASSRGAISHPCCRPARRG